MKEEKIQGGMKEGMRRYNLGKTEKGKREKVGAAVKVLLSAPLDA